jgi:4-azaleucine resistance transporter AzlC
MEDAPITEATSKDSAWAIGFGRAMPIVLGYVPIGFAFGVLAQKAGISALHAILMSVLVYAGSAQLVAVGLINANTPPLSMVLTTFVVNLRHMLMSAALSPYLADWRPVEIAAFTYELTDETFAVHAARFDTGEWEKSVALTTNVVAQGSWVLGTGLGAVAGQAVSDVRPWGLDYALPAMFIALLVLQIKDKAHILVAVFSGLLALGLHLAGAGQWSVIITTVVGAAVGVGFETWTRRRSS